MARQGKVIRDAVRLEFDGRFKIGEGVVWIVGVIGIEIWIELLHPAFRLCESDDGRGIQRIELIRFQIRFPGPFGIHKSSLNRNFLLPDRTVDLTYFPPENDVVWLVVYGLFQVLNRNPVVVVFIC